MMMRFLLFTCFLLSTSHATSLNRLTPIQWTTNGLKVYYLHDDYLPMVDIQLLAHAGAATTSPGLAYLTNQLLDQGSQGASQADISRDFESVGALYHEGITQDYALTGIRVLSRQDYLNTAINTWVTMLSHPLFLEKQCKQTKANMLVMYREIQQSPSGLNQQALKQALYPKHPYRHLLIGQPDMLTTLHTQQLQAFFYSHYRATNSVLVIVGNLDTQQAHQISVKVAQALPKGPAPRLHILPMTPPKATQITKTFQATQASVSLGQIGINIHDPNKLPLNLAAYILGGHMHSLLQDTLRNQQGLTYGAYSYFTPLAQPGPFVIALRTKAQHAQLALKLSKDTTEKFLKQGPNAQQLSQAKQRFTTAFQNQMATASGQLSALRNLAIYDLPIDYLSHYLTRLNQITPIQIKQAMQQTLHPNQWISVIVQPKPTAH